LFIWYQTIHNTLIYNIRENKLAHGHNDVMYALNVILFSQTTENIGFCVADKRAI